MVIGHSSLPIWAARWIWSFHMPFFFFISALCINWSKDNFSDFFYRKAKILLLPFAVYSVIDWILIPFATGESHLKYLYNIIENGWGGIALWFVPVFFASMLICKAIPRKHLFISAISCLTIGSILSWFEINLPWASATIPFAASTMLFTRYFQPHLRHNIAKLNFNAVNKCLYILSGLGLSIFISHFWRLDLACNQITPTIPLIAGIIGGITFIISLSLFIEQFKLINNVFIHIGRNTYEIMALSQAIIMTISIFIPEHPYFRYFILIIALICAVYLRKVIEGNFSKVEAI